MEKYTGMKIKKKNIKQIEYVHMIQDGVSPPSPPPPLYNTTILLTLYLGKRHSTHRWLLLGKLKVVVKRG